MCIRNNMDLVYINEYTQFYQNLSICSQEIEDKHIFYINQGPQLLKINRIICIRHDMNLVYVDAYTKFFIKIHPFVLKILRKNTGLHQSRVITVVYKQN